MKRGERRRGRPLLGLPKPLESDEVRRWRPCLAEGHTHKILTTKAIRMCVDAKRYAPDPYFSDMGGVGVRHGSVRGTS